MSKFNQLYIGEKIRIQEINGNVYEGEIIGVDTAQWSESGEDELIVADDSGSFDMFAESAIEDIEVLN